MSSQTSNTTLCVAAWSDQGRERDYQEDNYCIGQYLSSGIWTIPADAYLPDDKGTLLVVADGMGGLNAGEVASKIAVEAVQEFFVAGRLDDASYQNQPGQLLQEIILYANRRIIEHARQHPNTEGMGTTLVLAWILDNALYVGWSGDSRCYLVRQGQIRQVNKDHSYVQELIDSNAITLEEAFYHPNKHIITQSLGDVGRPPVPDYTYSSLQPGDRILLCSDGLNTMLQDDEIADIFAYGNLNQCVRSLVDAANAAGGHDNITVVACELQGESPVRQNMANTNAPNYGKNSAANPPTGTMARFKKMSPFVRTLILIGLPALVIGLGILLSNLFLRTMQQPPESLGQEKEKSESKNSNDSTSSEGISPTTNIGHSSQKQPNGQVIGKNEGLEKNLTNENSKNPVDASSIKENKLKKVLDECFKRPDATGGVCLDILNKIQYQYDMHGYDHVKNFICKESVKVCGIQDLKNACDCDQYHWEKTTSPLNTIKTDNLYKKQDPKPQSNATPNTGKTWDIRVVTNDSEEGANVNHIKYQNMFKERYVEKIYIKKGTKKDIKTDKWQIVIRGFPDKDSANAAKAQIMKDNPALTGKSEPVVKEH